MVLTSSFSRRTIATVSTQHERTNTARKDVNKVTRHTDWILNEVFAFAIAITLILVLVVAP